MTSPLPPPPWASCRSFESIEALRAAWRLLEAPLLSTSGRGDCRCLVALVDLGGLRIAGTRLSGSVFTAGYSSADELTVTVVLEAAGGSVNGLPLEPGAIFVYPPGTLYRGWSPAGYRWLTVTLSRDDAVRFARGHAWTVPDLRGGAILAARCSAEDMRSIRAMVRDVDLWRPRPRPEPLDPERVARHLAAWGSILGRAWVRGAPRRAAARRVRGDAILKRTVDFLESHLAEEVGSAEVCAAAGAPERTVEHLFRLRLGIPPMRYLLVLRLRAARKALLPGRSPAEVTVADVARSVGFRHLGRFAAAYRRMFGESPVETRRTERAVAAERSAESVDLLEEMVWGGGGPA